MQYHQIRKIDLHLPLVFMLVLSFYGLIRCSEPIHVQSLIVQSQNMELRYESQNLLQKDDTLELYLNEVLGKLATEQELDSFHLRARVLRSRSINAFATPHGTIYVCTGIMARMTSEAQLAALLAHELIHVLNHHSEKNLIRMKESSQSHAEARIGLGVLLGDGISGAITGAALKSAVTGYSRDLEREADSLGLKRMMHAGYPAKEFLQLFKILQEHLISENIKEPYFFSTHPLIEERIANYYSIIGKNTSDIAASDSAVDVFGMRAREVVLYDARVNHAAGRPDLAGYQVERLLDMDTSDVQSLVLMGDIERQISPQSTESIRWYKKALENDSLYPAALRGVAFVSYTLGQFGVAREYFEKYCQVVPDAFDIKMVKEYMARCAH